MLIKLRSLVLVRSSMFVCLGLKELLFSPVGLPSKPADSPLPRADLAKMVSTCTKYPFALNYFCNLL